MKPVIISGDNLTLDELRRVCCFNAPVQLSDDAVEKINLSRLIVDQLVEQGETVYGVTTGFGKFSDIKISSEDCKKIQKNLIITHAVGAGEPFDIPVVRGIMLLRINNIAKGFSGARLIVVKTIIDMLNRGVTPIIPQKGSLGASGDLAPLAHMILPIIGLGEAWFQGDIYPGSEAMERAGIATVELVEKEGLALINGTQAMTSSGALTTIEALELLEIANIAAALSMEGNRAIIDSLDPRLHKVRSHPGQIETAKHLRDLLQGSSNVTRQGELRVQDGYSLRCIPQVHGASLDTLRYVGKQVVIEMNSVTDNPIVFPDTRQGISGGNFHGQPMALSFDFLGIALSELANISERRIERLVNPSISGLPAFLTRNGGLNTGFMILQYSAASLVSENKVLAHPASIDSIPSSANQEDHVSMGTISARKAGEILKNLRRVLAMELMCSCQAIDIIKGKERLGLGTRVAYETIRQVCQELDQDRPLYDDINRCESLLINRVLLDQVHKTGITLNE